MPPLTAGIDHTAASGRVVDPTNLDLAQRTGNRCVDANCRRLLFRDKVFFGALPDGSALFVCPGHEAVER